MEKELKHNSIKSTDSATVITGTRLGPSTSHHGVGGRTTTPLRIYGQLIVVGGRGIFFSVIATGRIPVLL